MKTAEQDREYKAYQKAYRHFSKERNTRTLLKMRRVEPTIEDIETMIKAVKAYCSKSPHYNNYEEVLGEGYEALARALLLYDESKNKNRQAYIYQKIKYGMIDAYRAQFGRENSPRREHLTRLSSLNYTVKNDEGECEYISLLEGSNPETGLGLDYKYFRGRVKKEFIKIKGGYKVNGRMLFKIWEEYKMMGYTMEEVGERNGVSESRISQLMAQYCIPTFEKVKKQLVDEFGDDFLS